jgi:monovalent cation/hydrogen antiporter
VSRPETYVALLAAITVLAGLGRAISVPYPIVLMLGGLALGFIPGVPVIVLDPEVVFFIFLPPLLHAAAYYGSSTQELRAHRWPIGLLSIGLVLVTTFAVAIVAHAAIDGLAWTAAFTLGAIVSPTDPVAAAAVFQRLRVPRRVVTIVEGESLLNDATALTAYRVSIAAATAGTFSVWAAGVEFLAGAAGGIAVGLVAGRAVAWVRGLVDNPTLVISITLLTPYLAYVPAERLHVSGVLAAVTVGLYMGRRDPKLLAPGTRLQYFAFWDTTIFLLNSVLFILVGNQLTRIVDDLSSDGAGELVAYAALVGAVVIVVRLLFILAVPSRAALAGLDEAQPLDRRERLLVGWSGMRGAVSLAAALAIPLTTEAGEPFPDRSLVVFLTFGVIFATLVLQGLSLPALIRRLSFGAEDDEAEMERRSRIEAAEAALERLESFAASQSVADSTLDVVREHYEECVRRLGRRDASLAEEADETPIHDVETLQGLRYQALSAERETIGRLLEGGEISYAVMRRIERDLDLEEALVIGGDRSRA